MRSISLLYNFLRRYALIAGQPHEIHTAGQVADINLRFRLGDWAGDELLTSDVGNG